MDDYATRLSNQCPLCQNVISEGHYIGHMEEHYMELQNKRRIQTVMKAMTTGKEPAKAVMDLAFLLINKKFITEEDMYQSTGVDFRHAKEWHLPVEVKRGPVVQNHIIMD